MYIHVCVCVFMFFLHVEHVYIGNNYSYRNSIGISNILSACY